MYKLIAFLFIMLSITACKSENSKNTLTTGTTTTTQYNDVVNVTYINKINNYSVSAIWSPSKLRYSHVIGPAIITFTNHTTQEAFSITNNNFSILKTLLPFTFDENEEILKVKNDIKINYEPTVLSNEDGFGITSVPFFFQDINFDDREELLITEVDNGQKGAATFKVYSFDESGEIETDLYGITYQEPFISLDQYSQINYEDKSISIYGYGGWCAGGRTIYQSISSKYGSNTFRAVIEDELEEIGGDCYLKKYKLSEPQRMLIATEKIK